MDRIENVQRCTSLCVQNKKHPQIWYRGKKMLAQAALLVLSHLAIAIHSFPALSPFSSLSLGQKLFRQGFLLLEQ